MQCPNILATVWISISIKPKKRQKAFVCGKTLKFGIKMPMIRTVVSCVIHVFMALTKIWQPQRFCRQFMDYPIDLYPIFFYDALYMV